MSAVVPVDVRRRAMNWRRGGSFSARRRRDGWLLVAPTLVAVLALGVFPLLYSLVLSFRRWDLQVVGRPFVGLATYGAAIRDERVWASLLNTVTIMVVGVGAEFL